MVEAASAANLKQTWVNTASAATGTTAPRPKGPFLRHATQVKNVWVPYGERSAGFLPQEIIRKKRDDGIPR